MICPRCSNEIEDGSLICPHCQEQVAVGMQRAKIAAAKRGILAKLKNSFRSPVFLVLAIALSVMSLFKLLYAISIYNPLFPELSIFLIVIGAIPFIFSLISMIGAWKLYGSDANPASGLGSLRVYSVFIQVIFTIGYVCTIIGAVSFAFLAVASASGLKEMVLEALEAGAFEVSLPAETMKLFVDNLTVGLFAIVFGFIVATVLLVLMASAYKKTQKYLSRLANTCDTLDYNEKEPQPYGILIFAAVMAILGVVGSIGTVFSLLVSVADITYLICMIIFLKNVHTELYRAKLEIAALEKEFAQIVDATNDEFLARQRRQEAAVCAAQEEAAKAQQMMAQMMAEQMAMASTTATAPANDAPTGAACAEETPAAEEAVAEEAPAEEAPVEEAPAEETPAEEAPAEEAPVEDAPVEEAPAEDAPVEEAPAEEAPAEEAPVEDAPVEENTEA